MRPWHAITEGETLTKLGSDSKNGLTKQEADRRLTQYGPNRLAAGKERSLLSRFAEQVRDPMILILLAAAVLSLMAGGGEDWAEAVIILGIVVLNACISISQETNAEKALEALRSMSAPQARVVRDGQPQRVDTSQLVPGDLILLEAGDLVPADARILSCAGLKTDESAMTGEWAPVNKEAGTLPADTPLGDRSNCLLASTSVTSGRAEAVVTATGMDTEVGRIAGMLLEEDGSDTPLQRKMGEISKTLSFLCLAVCAVMFGVGLLQGTYILDMFLTAVSLAVAAIPEGLPAIVTIVLALGVQRMARRSAIVRKLPAVETLGCAGVICSDKTGTLTQNKMTVTQIWSLKNAHRTETLAVGALCNDAVLSEDKPRGDPTEIALLEAALAEGLDKLLLEHDLPRRGEIPFDSNRKLMTTIHPWKGGWRAMVKGAPDVLLARCTRALDGGVRTLTPALRQEIAAANESMAAHALRVLGCAYRDLDSYPAALEADWLENDLTFCGLVGMMDPPRPEVKEAVAQCRGAGVRTVMITGDHKLTAVAIAKELDIYRPGDGAITGEDLDFMPQALLEEEVHRFSVYARVSPEHKLRIVRAWQKRNMVVAMTGDGVNDAPALKAADIGCAMGISGTDVAKGAADMILTDDNFATIVEAVEQGRGIYANIRKAIHYLLSCNIGEIVAIFLATLLGFGRSPLTAVQLLWLNLVTDSLPALALGMEPVEPGVMEERPRSADDSLFTREFSLRLAWQGAAVGAVTLAAYWLGERVFGQPQAANTMAFCTLTISQLFHAFDVRSRDRPVVELGVGSNPAMNKAFIIGLTMQLAVLCLPFLRTVFGVVLLSPGQWLAVGVLSLTPVALCEGEKLLRRAKRGIPREKERVGARSG